MTQTTSEVIGQAGDGAQVAVVSRATVEAFSRRRDEPDWLREARLAAWERYEALAKPTQRDDGWRRTDIRALDLDRLAAPAQSSQGQVSPELAEVTPDASDLSGLLVLRDGQVHQRILDDKLAARGVLLLSLAEAVAQHPELVRERLSRPRSSKVAELGAALWNDGAVVYIPRGLVVELPIQIVHWSDAPGGHFFQTVVVADEASSAAVVESFGSPADRAESLSSGAVDVVLKQASRVSYANLQERDEQAWNFASLRSEQDRDSAMTWLLLNLGGRLSRNELACEMLGVGSEADLHGVVFGHREQHFDLQSVQEHVGNDTRSDLLLQVALRDRSSSNFTGMIRVGEKALRTSSNQVNHNLLLDAGARADSDPKLEILNSDVTRCGHGAAVGPVDQELIFYLRSRGLTAEEAERLIVEGFFEPVLSRVPIKSVRERLLTSIRRKLEN